MWYGVCMANSKAKPKLTSEQLVQKMRDEKGILFNLTTEKEAEIYDARVASENERFSDFEKLVEEGKLAETYDVHGYIEVENDYQPHAFDKTIEDMTHTKNLIESVSNLAKLGIDCKYFQNIDDEGRILVSLNENGTTTETYLAPEMFATKVLAGDESFNTFMREILSLFPFQVGD